MFEIPLKNAGNNEPAFVPTAVDPTDHGVLRWQYEFDDQSTLWKDMDGTIQVATPGDPIRRINDKSGNGLDLTNSQDGFAPKWGTFDGQKFGGVFYNNAGVGHYLRGSNIGTPWAHLSDGSEYTLIMHLKHAVLNPDGPTFQSYFATQQWAASASAGAYHAYQKTGNQLVIQVSNTEEGKDGADVWVSGGPGDAITSLDPITITMTVSGTFFFVRINGTATHTIPQDLLPASTYAIPFNVGAASNVGVNPFTGSMYRLWAYTAPLTGANLTNAEADIAL
jgi:hypothetical protein